MLLCWRHSFSKCFLEGVQTLAYDDSSFVLGTFLEAFSVCFQEQVKSWFCWPLQCESYDLRLRKAPFSLLFCSLCHDAFLERIFCSCYWFLRALRTPFGHLWDHITMFFPLLIFSGFLRCAFLTFRLPRGGPNACRRHARGTCGTWVKQQCGFITSGFASVKPHSVTFAPVFLR